VDWIHLVHDREKERAIVSTILMQCMVSLSIGPQVTMARTCGGRLLIFTELPSQPWRPVATICSQTNERYISVQNNEILLSGLNKIHTLVEEGAVLGPWHSVNRLSVGILGDRINDSHKRAVKSVYVCFFQFFSHLTQNQFRYVFFNLHKSASDVLLY
jgi:hypothetical protein